MYKWFDKVKMPSYVNPVEGDFEIDYDLILESTLAYETLRESMDKPDISKDELNELFWGDRKARQFKLWQVEDFKHTCSPEVMANLKSDILTISDWYEQVVWSMPMTYLLIFVGLELYLYFWSRGKRIFTLYLDLFYGYIYFLTIVHFFYTLHGINSIDFE